MRSFFCSCRRCWRAISRFGRGGNLAPVVWLALASLAFYSLGNWQYVPLLLASIAFNYGIGYLADRAGICVPRRDSRCSLPGSPAISWCSASSNMPAFSPPIVNALFSAGFVVHILLPVGISFYTFTQIAFLVDAYRGQVARYALPHYALFVTYFPHLIAGPILHHRDMIPQFEQRAKPNGRIRI